MKTTLIMLPQPIVVSDEQLAAGKEFGKGYYVNGYWHTIIAGVSPLPTIDFNALSEDVCKRIGWCNIEQLAMSYLDKTYSLSYERTTWQKLHEKTFAEGFKTALEFTEKRFTMEDLRHAFNEALLIPSSDISKADDIFQQVLSAISKPKMYDVEIEMQLRDADEVYAELQSKHTDYLKHHFHFYDSGRKTIKREYQHLYMIPVVTNNAIKILRVL